MLNVRIARTWEDQERGLGGVKYMPEDEGMLFEFDYPRILTFWGKDTYIPLDIAFVSNDIITKIARIAPMDLNAVRSGQPANIAIEANAGFFSRFGIKVGDRIDVTDRLRARLSAYLNHQLDADRCIIRFERAGQLIEGTAHSSEKEIEGRNANSKVSQTLPEPSGKIEKPDHKVIGDPIGQPPPQQTDMANLPVLDTSDIGAMLEDAYDEDEEQQAPPEDQGMFPQEEQPQEGQPFEQPQEEQPEEKQYPVFSNPFQAAEWAQQNNEVMRIAYTTARGRQLTRDVEPNGQFHSKSTHRQILVTWDRTVNDIRAFILQNIGSWAFTGQQFQKKFVVRG